MATQEVRQCKTCGEVKPLDADHFYYRPKHGYRHQCWPCFRAQKNAKDSETWRSDPARRARKKAAKQTEAYKEASRAYSKIYNQSPGIRERQRLARQAPEAKVRAKIYNTKRRSDPEYRMKELADARAKKKTPEYKARERKKYAENSKRRQYFANRYQEKKHDPEFRARLREYENEKKRTDPVFYLRVTISSALHAMFRNYLKEKKQGRSWTKLFDFTAKELKAHLEAKFTGDMSWGNKGYWELDHIVPISWWGITSVDDPNFKRCWSLQNMQPLWADDNRRKHGYRALINGTLYTKETWIADGRPMPDDRLWQPHIDLYEMPVDASESP